jgi:hypothetical protein
MADLGNTAAAATHNVTSNMPGATEEQRKLFSKFGIGTKALAGKVGNSIGSAHSKNSPSPSKRSRSDNTESPPTGTTSASTPETVKQKELHDFIESMAGTGSDLTPVKKLAEIFQATLNTMNSKNNDNGNAAENSKTKTKGRGRGRNTRNGNDSGATGNSDRDTSKLSVEQRLSRIEGQITKHAKVLSFHDTALRLDRRENQLAIEMQFGAWIDTSLDAARLEWVNTLPKADGGDWVEHPEGPWRECAWKLFTSLVNYGLLSLAKIEHPTKQWEAATHTFVDAPADAATSTVSDEVVMGGNGTSGPGWTLVNGKRETISTATSLDEYTTALTDVHTMSSNVRTVQRFYKLKLANKENDDGTTSEPEHSIWILRIDKASTRGRNVLSAMDALKELDMYVHLFDGSLRADHAPKSRLIKEIERTFMPAKGNKAKKD